MGIEETCEDGRVIGFESGDRMGTIVRMACRYRSDDALAPAEMRSAVRRSGAFLFGFRTEGAALADE
jgi:hypothetical protein